METPKYILHFYFEWGGGCLWAGNDDCDKDFGCGPYDADPCPLPLSVELLRRCWEMAEWHDTLLNWDYPPHPGPWRQEECDCFNVEVKKLLADIRNELGSKFEVINKQVETVEDKDLDEYLANPKEFRRN